jgi:hypothetical protein
LSEEFQEQGLINNNTKLNYALAAGKIHGGDEAKLISYFSKRGLEAVYSKKY